MQNKYFMKIYIQISILKEYSRKFECLGRYTCKKILKFFIEICFMKNFMIETCENNWANCKNVKIYLVVLFSLVRGKPNSIIIRILFAFFFCFLIQDLLKDMCKKVNLLLNLLFVRICLHIWEVSIWDVSLFGMYWSA